MTPVGRAMNVEIQVSSDLKPLHEQGQHITQIRREPWSAGRSAGPDINGALLKLMLGDVRDRRPVGIGCKPSSNITTRL